MDKNLISASLNAKDKQAIMEAIQTIREKLPFLIDLSKQDRQHLPKLGDKSRAFVEKALEVAKQNVDMLPRSFEPKEFEQDLQLFSDMSSIFIALSQLNELVDDTTLAVGSDAYSAALDVYTYAKAARIGSGLEELKGMMAKRFTKKANSQDTSKETDV